MQRVTEVRVLEQLVQNFQMVWQPAIVAAEIGDDAAVGFAQRFVPMHLALARSLGKVEEPYARVGANEFLGDGARRLVDTVADEEHLDVTDGLVQRAAGGKAKGCSVAVNGNDDGGDRHVTPTAATRPPTISS